MTNTWQPPHPARRSGTRIKPRLKDAPLLGHSVPSVPGRVPQLLTQGLWSKRRFRSNAPGVSSAGKVP